MTTECSDNGICIQARDSGTVHARATNRNGYVCECGAALKLFIVVLTNKHTFLGVV